MIQVTPTTRGPGVTKEETKGSGGGGGGGAESVQQRRGFDLQVRGQRGGGRTLGLARRLVGFQAEIASTVWTCRLQT